MVSKYLIVHHSIRDGEIEYGDKSVVELVSTEEINLTDIIDNARIKSLLTKTFADENFGEEDEDWEFNDDGQAEGIHGEYRILEVEMFHEISKENFDVLKLYLGMNAVEA